MKKLKLIYKSPLSIVAKAIRYSHHTHNQTDTINDIIGIKDRELIKKVAFALNHSSVLEHFNFIIETDCQKTLNFFSNNKYSSVIKHQISSNLRVLNDNIDESFIVEIIVLLELADLFGSDNNSLKSLIKHVYYLKIK